MTKINERIRVPRVRVIFGSGQGEQLGVMNTHEAVAKAKEYGLDLVEVASNADPPVCRIVDYGKYKYEQSKQKKANPKTKGGKIKEVKFRVRIDQHDYNIKMGRSEDFLDEGNKLRVQLQFRGRENAHPELGFVLMKRVQDDLSTMAQVDMEPRRAGRGITMMLSPLAEDRRVRKFKPVSEDEADMMDEKDAADDAADAEDGEVKASEEASAPEEASASEEASAPEKPADS